MIPSTHVQFVSLAKSSLLLLLLPIAFTGSIGCKPAAAESAEAVKESKSTQSKISKNSGKSEAPAENCGPDGGLENKPSDHDAKKKAYKYKMGASDASGVDPSTLHEPKVGEKVVLTEEEWKKRLSPQQYHIMREAATERAWTGSLNLVKQKDGMFHCAACNAPLFRADKKFESGSGWPSFYEANKGRIELREDNSFGMKRTEIVCASCGAHLGHLFNDGPAPTGLRYCVNSAALNFSADEKDEPHAHPPTESKPDQTKSKKKSK